MLDADRTLTRAELARRLGISRAAVTQALRR
ncbi:MAG: winged helix-turn-helix transcriptional regulator [Myxococcales bacterium]|nr:winged helix-turn-helix transcriptional regulator [Myxococcales bacterium]